MCVSMAVGRGSACDPDSFKPLPLHVVPLVVCAVSLVLHHPETYFRFL
jgi:hypothetical protein